MEGDPLLPLAEVMQEGKAEMDCRVDMDCSVGEGRVGDVDTRKGMAPNTGNTAERGIGVEEDWIAGEGGAAEPKELPEAKGRSWASIVEGNKVDEEDSVSDVQIREVNGKKELFIPNSAHEKLKAPFRFSAIATLSAGRTRNRLDYGFVFAALHSLWVGLSPIKFSSVGKGLFLIRASTEADLQMILMPGRWSVGGRMLLANRWQPGLPLKIEASHRVRIWVRFPDLPPELWRKGVFQRLAELMGVTFVEADAFTKDIASLGYARVMLEVPLGFQPVNEIRISFEEGPALLQSVEYETKVKYCLRCGATTHFTFACEELKQAPSTQQAVGDDGKAWLSVKSPKRRSFIRNTVDGLNDKANRFSALHSMPDTAEELNVQKGATKVQLGHEEPMEQDHEEAGKEKEHHDAGTLVASSHNKAHKLSTVSGCQGQLNMESMAVDVVNDQTTSGETLLRRTSIEKKRQLRSKVTSSFKKRLSSLPQPEKLLSGHIDAYTDPGLHRPQTIDHSGFRVAEARASPAATDPGDQGMSDVIPKEANNHRNAENDSSPNQADMVGSSSVLYLHQSQ